MFRIVVNGFAIYMEKTVKFHNFSCGIERIRLVTDADIYGSLLNFRIRHLGGYGTFPYQVIQFSFLWTTFYFSIFHVGRTNGFVSLLSAFGLRGEMTRIYVTFSHHAGND